VIGATVVLVAAGAAGAAHAASTSVARTGAILLDGRPVFPIVLAPGPLPGTTTPWGTDALAETVAAGVDVFKVGPGNGWTGNDLASTIAWDQAAAALGAYTWVNLNGYASARPRSADDWALAQVVHRLTNDPSGSAIAFWKGRDEPWWHGRPPASLRFAYCRVTSRGKASWCHGERPLAPDRLWVTIEAPRGTAADLRRYGAVTDVHGIDDYPITLANPSPNLNLVGSWTRMLASARPAVPVWTTLQICAKGSFSASNGTFVLPTLQQERYMAYDAILNGARALAFYGGNVAGCWSPTDAQYGWNWTFWQNVLQPLVGELSASSPIAPALDAPETSRPVKTSDASTKAVLRDGTSPDDLWLIAARSGAGTETVTFSGLPAWVTSGSVYTENRTVTAAGGSFSDEFGQWDVHVYHFVEPLTLESQQPASGTAGTKVALGGAGLAATTSVTFDGHAARFRIVSDNEVVATVPASARSGPLVVESATSSVTSASSFAVLPSAGSPPRIRGLPRVGRILTASRGSWRGDPPTRTTFLWERCDAHGLGCNGIPGATGQRIRLGTKALGKTFRVIVTVQTDTGSASARSQATPRVVR